MYRLVSTICAFVVALVITSAELFYFGNFCVIRHPVLSVLVHSDLRMNCGQGHFTADWLWLYHNEYPQISPYIAYAHLVLAGVFVILMIGVILFERFVLFRAGNKTIHGKHDSESLHGNARWATEKDVKLTGLLQKGDGGVVVGGYKGKQLIDRSGLHNLIFAPTGSGKGIGIVTPTLYQWDQSAIVLDIKPELYPQTGGYRASQGHRILPFNPSNEHSIRFNPLAEIRVGTSNAIADCQLLANVFVNPGAIKGDNKFFANEAYTWVTVLFLHVVYKAKIEEKPVPCLRDVYKFMNTRSDDCDQDSAPEVSDHNEEDSDPYAKLCQGMIDFDHEDEYVNDAVSARATQMKEMHEKTRSSVISSANEPFNLLFMDPLIIRNTSVSDFTIESLMNGDRPSTLYLMFSPKHIERLSSLFRVFIELFLAKTLDNMGFADGRAQSNNKYKMLLLMDEFSSIGKLESYEKGLAYMRGYGVKSMIVIQNKAQIDKLYTKENAFFSNSDILSTYYSNDLETQQMLSKMCGKTTHIQMKTSVSGEGGKKSRSVSEQEVARDLILPDEVGRLKKTAPNNKNEMEAGENIVFVGGCSPIFGDVYMYFVDPILKARSLIPLPDLVIDGKVIPYADLRIKAESIS